ncbi:acetolactate synthase small subunit [Kroppenstedtia eburnea]|uniref:Acetolactate synthase small subunit n=1 Tax=Kroppenstedtia eburnea TaxID=714067 RepID=A0A1N7LWW5_9BACL|nr:acetolactate synthase small subunit [Kroppenstedtia eburnea]EGK06792.1 acetolactate synthase small subunit [Desmospora sp. 8437]QKI81687.1 acetolactate synthase small subunit [Kroppenstedtia eburnea]SIS78320.1 acetolactate synthase, small subunit [Kroppenstedtia eburnea]
MRHILSVLVNDQPRVLARVAGLLGRRNFNIESISVGESEEPGLSRMVIATRGDEQTMEQVQKQLHKLVDVIKVQDLHDHSAVERELLLVKVGAGPATRMEISGIIEPFRASIVDVGPHSLIVQATGERSKLDALMELLHPYGIKEVARTGVTALSRGANKAGVALTAGG